VQVLGVPDLGLGRPATQSSTLAGSNAVAARAVDGQTDGKFADNSVMHTNADLDAWWKLDLLGSTPITSIDVYNRTDCCGSRLADFWVFVSDTPFNTTLTPAQQAAQPGVWSSHQSTTPNPLTTVALSAGTTGRYVMVQQNSAQFLSLAEVAVH
jgi:hypothetical protein